MIDEATNNLVLAAKQYSGFDEIKAFLERFDRVQADESAPKAKKKRKEP